MNEEPHTGDPPVVMVVDDDEDIADLYSRELSEGFKVITAYGGGEALRKLNDSVDVVLLDRRMPDINGDEVLEEIRNRGIDCRVVMVTAVDPDLDIIALDFDDYITKPVEMDELLDAVNRMLARDTHDKQVQEAFALASKMAALEARMDIDDLEQSTEYAKLEKRFSELRELIEDVDPEENLYGELSVVKMQALFEDS